MKYSEFKTIAKENGWEFSVDEVTDKWVYANKNGFEIAIKKDKQNYFDLYPRQGGVINLHREKEFIEACYELVETPIEDREDEKYYVVELPFLNAADEELFLRRSFAAPYWCTIYASRFTEKEIRELDPRLWEFAVEVEGV